MCQRRHYGWKKERLFHRFKDQPLGIRPLYVRRDDQIQGLTHLVTLALRVLTLFELLVRRGQQQSGEKLQGLYPGLPNRMVPSLEKGAGVHSPSLGHDDTISSAPSRPL